MKELDGVVWQLALETSVPRWTSWWNNIGCFLRQDTLATTFTTSFSFPLSLSLFSFMIRDGGFSPAAFSATQGTQHVPSIGDLSGPFVALALSAAAVCCLIFL